MIDPVVGDDSITFKLPNYKNDLSIVAKKCQPSILKLSKTFQKSDAPTKVIKENADLFSNLIHSVLNKDIQCRNLPSCQKLAHETLIFKKCLRCDCRNYRPVSIVPNVSKLFDRPLFKEMFLIFDRIVSTALIAFDKRYQSTTL